MIVEQLCRNSLSRHELPTKPQVSRKWQRQRSVDLETALGLTCVGNERHRNRLALQLGEIEAGEVDLVVDNSASFGIEPFRRRQVDAPGGLGENIVVVAGVWKARCECDLGRSAGKVDRMCFEF